MCRGRGQGIGQLEAVGDVDRADQVSDRGVLGEGGYAQQRSKAGVGVDDAVIGVELDDSDQQ